MFRIIRKHRFIIACICICIFPCINFEKIASASICLHKNTVAYEPIYETRFTHNLDDACQRHYEITRTICKDCGDVAILNEVNTATVSHSTKSIAFAYDDVYLHIRVTCQNSGCNASKVVYEEHHGRIPIFKTIKMVYSAIIE